MFKHYAMYNSFKINVFFSKEFISKIGLVYFLQVLTFKSFS